MCAVTSTQTPPTREKTAFACTQQHSNKTDKNGHDHQPSSFVFHSHTTATLAQKVSTSFPPSSLPSHPFTLTLQDSSAGGNASSPCDSCTAARATPPAPTPAPSGTPTGALPGGNAARMIVACKRSRLTATRIVPLPKQRLHHEPLGRARGHHARGKDARGYYARSNDAAHDDAQVYVTRANDARGNNAISNGARFHGTRGSDARGSEA